MSPAELTCAEAGALLELAVDGELETPDAERLARHVTRCADCAAELELAEGIRSELRALPELEPPAVVLDRVRSGVASEAARGARVTPLPLRAPLRPVARRRWAVGAALAAALAALLGTVLLLRSSAPPPPPSAADIGLATRQARFALAYVTRVTRTAGLTVRDDVIEKRVILPATLTVARPLDPQIGPSLDARSRRGT